jgi:CDP-diacylglycerol--glycerol-3-phosphate 3-phosphatidyltransferase
MTPEPRWTIPNILSVARLAGTPLLFLLVRLEPVTWFVVGYAIVGITDFLDGWLARAWHQTSAVGAMLDSVADVVFYLSTAYFAWVLFPDYLLPNRWYIAACIVLLVAQVAASRWLLGRVVMPHTHLSRLAGLLAVVVFFLSLVMDTTILFRVVVLLYSVAFIEMMAMFRLDRDLDHDTRSILVLRRRRMGRTP